MEFGKQLERISLCLFISEKVELEFFMKVFSYNYTLCCYLCSKPIDYLGLIVNCYMNTITNRVLGKEEKLARNCKAVIQSKMFRIFQLGNTGVFS